MHPSKVAVAVPIAVVYMMAGAATPAYGQFNVLYEFGSNTGDPASPEYSGIIAQGRDGKLYSTTPYGGANDEGSVFKSTPAGAVTVIYSFDGTNGSLPFGGLTLGVDGDFYGTAYAGGTDYGTVFKVTPGGTITVLHDFADGTDGAYPYAPPIQDASGNWYGTTSFGGNTSACVGGCGTVYKITPAGTYSTLYQFDKTHGAWPKAPVVLGTDGNLYGTTSGGGSNEDGVVFRLTPAGQITTLFSFDVTHGSDPVSPVIQGTNGNLYGTTQNGGSGAGVVFELNLAGEISVLHDMNGTTDGSTPYAGVVQASDGNLYGANGLPVTDNSGTLFKVTSTAFSVLNSFNGTNGATPEVTPFQHSNGVIYGDTRLGGTGDVSPCSAGNCGVFYQLSENLPAFISLLPYSGRVGSQIGILGQGFSSTSVVKFNGVQATTTTLTGTTFILATVPTGASNGYVTVTTGATTLKSLRPFTVHNSWGLGAAMPTAVKSAAAGMINGQIHVVGGVNSAGTIVANNQIYNPANNSWSTGTALPATTYSAARAIVGNTLYVISGTTNGTTLTSAVWAYNPKTNTWSAEATIPTARAGAAATVENNIIYVIGGQDVNSNSLATVESYNPATNTWTEEAPLLVAKSFDSATLLGTTIVSAEGQTSVGVPTGDNEGYAGTTNSWRALADDPTARERACAGAISGLFYVAGGYDGGSAGTPALSLTESFALTPNTWTTLASMLEGSQQAASAVHGGQLYCFGGEDAQAGTVLDDVQIYQP